ncbi:MAG: fluoride efflux transporter CrcB [Pseudomonadota bacterium]
MMAANLLAVAAGGALGASMRYGAVLAVGHLLGTTYPYGTMLVNVLGSFVIGVVFQLARGGMDLSPTLLLFLMTGVLGGFTTFSAFSLDALKLLERGAVGAFATYGLLSVTLSLLAVIAGVWLVRAAAP